MVAAMGAAHSQPAAPDDARGVNTANTIIAVQRVALVIGNAHYASSPLVNPLNDARDMSQALREAGFYVIHRENADQRTMLLALREFGDRLRNSATGLFYFSGHGMQIKGRNYLIPVDATFEREDEAAYRTVDAQAVLDKMEAAGNMTNIMILDACRNNPFIRGSRSAQQGLAQIDAPVGTLLAYATAPGSVASDGTGTSNGLYTRHLLAAMRQPGNKVEDVFKQVRTAVRRDSAGKQVPWESTSLEGDFYFKPPAGAGQAAMAAAPVVPPAPSTAAASTAGADPIEAALWDAVRTSRQAGDVNLYLNRFPDGRFAAAARQRLAELAGPQAVLASAPARPPALASKEGFTPGDRWRYQVVDKFKGEVVRNYANIIDSVEADGGLVVNGGRLRWDSRGNLRAAANAEGDISFPSYAFVPESFQPGARSSMKVEIPRTVGGKLLSTDKGTVSLAVKNQERVVTPAGEFLAWRVEMEWYGSTSGAGRDEYRASQGGMNTWRLAVTGWYSPELRGYVAWDQELRTSMGHNNSSTSVHIERERHELTSFSVREGTFAAR